jgi:tight adherence protein C
MRLLLHSVLIIAALVGPCLSAWAQNVCPKEFSQVGVECIKNTNKNFGEVKLPLSRELEGNIYFYKTPNGGFGKFKIGSVTTNKAECTLYLDAVTYLGDQTFIPNTSITISRSKNQWLENRIYLDKEGLNALELRKGNSGCGIVFSKNVEVAFHSKESQIAKYEENNILFYAPLILIFIAIFLIVRVFLEDQDKFKTQEALEEAAENTKGKNQLLFIRVTRPFYKRYFVPLVQGSKNKQKIRNKYRQKLANAGLLKEMTPEEFVALKFFMILGGPFVFLAVRWIMEEQWSLAYTPIMAVVGYFYPELWLSGVISKRKDKILLAMPFIVDMLALSVEAGLDFMAAIQRVIEKAPPSPLVEEFETLIKETKIGSSRAEGLRQMGWRVNIIEINSFCATLIAADSVGASIAPILKQLSNELRVKRSSRAEQLGATAATKILFPMILFIMPAVIIAIFAPMILQAFGGKS